METFDLPVPVPTFAELAAASVPLRKETNETLRRVKLAMRVVLSRYDIDSTVTNAFADHLAAVALIAGRSSMAADALHDYAEQLLAEADAAGFNEVTTTRSVAEAMMTEAGRQRDRG